MTLYKITNAIEVPKNMLIVSGVWPQQSTTFWYKLRKFISYGGTMLLLALMFVEVAISISDIVRLSYIILLTLEYFAYAVRLIVFHLERLKIHSLSVKLRDPLLNSYGQEHNEFVKSAIERTNFLGNAFKVSCFLTTTFLALTPFIGDAIFPVPFSIFQEGFMWHVIYWVQVIGLAVGIWNNAGMDSLSIAYMGIALAELDILIYNIQHFADNVAGVLKSDSEVSEHLYSCCKHHNKIMEYIKNIEDLCTKSILVHYISSIGVICNSGFYLIMTPLFSGQFAILVVYFSAVMLELAMYCWVGNEIILKSLELGNACYMSKWYEFSPSINKILFLIMERSKRPLTISAYKFSVLSLSAYLKIIQSSYSYFTVLRRLYMKD